MGGESRHNASIARPRVFYVVTALAALVILGKLFFIQIVQGETYQSQAERQYVHSSVELFNRGAIYFQQKDGALVSAATLKEGARVAIDPQEITQPQSVYKKLNAVIELERVSFFQKARKTDDPYEEVARHVPPEKGEKVRELDLTGVMVGPDQWRFYPGDTRAAHTLGFVGFDGDALNGRYGLERYYDATLERKRTDTEVNFFADIISNLGATLLSASNERAGNVVTHIEPNVQSYLEKRVRNIREKWNAEEAGAIVIDPHTGHVKAMASVPTYNPNVYAHEENEDVFANPLVEHVYEMGSIVKPLTMAAGLDAGVVTPETTYMDKGVVTVNGSEIHNYDGEARGEATMQTVLNQSLNTGAVHVMQKLGKEQFRAYMRGYGLGQKTGIDLPNESAGLLKNLHSKRDIEYATASFGQGIATTPIAITRALSALANNGLLPSPRVTKAIEYEDGRIEPVKAPSQERALSKETAREITRMLATVFDEEIAPAHDVEMPHYRVAAKTGTAQMAKPHGDGYYANRYLHSYFGYAPAYDPEFLVFFYTVDPKGVRYASQTLTEPFVDTTKFLLNYYEVPPTR